MGSRQGWLAEKGISLEARKVCWLLVLLKPVVAQAQLYSVKLWISLAEVGVRDMPPMTADIQGLLLGGEYLNSTTASGCEIEV